MPELEEDKCRDPNVLVGRLAELSLDVLFDGYRPRVASFPEPRRLIWHDLDIELVDGALRLRGSNLVLRIGSDSAEEPFNFLEYSDVRNKPAKVELEDGSVVDAPFPTLNRWGIGGETRHLYWADLEMPVWEWLPPRNVRGVFLGRTNGLVTDISDNLSLRRGQEVNHGHFRGIGSFVWHVIQGDTETTVLAEGTAGNRIYQTLRGDISALQFVLGSAVGLDILWLVDAKSKVIGGVGLGRGKPRTDKCRRPAPHGHAEENCWAAPLFRRIAAQVARDDRHISTAMAGYLDALRGHIHGGYLLGQVALEAFCREVAPKKKARPVVTSVKDWQSWVKANEKEIVKHCPDQVAAGVLVKRLLNSVTQPPSGEVVQGAFGEWGIELPKVLVDELGRRAPAAHKFVMFDEETGDIQDAADRMNMVQFLLAAAVAKSVGYEGPLVGWERDGGGNLQTPKCWPVQSNSEAAEWFACWRERDHEEPWT